MRRGLAVLAACCAGAALGGCSSASASDSALVGAAGSSAGAAATAGGSHLGGAGSDAAGNGGANAGGSAGESAGAANGGSAGASMAGNAGMSQGGTAAAGPRFIGRFDKSNAAAPVFAWSGTAIAVRFQGTAVSATLTDSGNNVFEVVVDGKSSVIAGQPGKKQYALATGLASGAHDLLLYRRTEAFFGETTFNGFDLAASAYLPGNPAPARRLEVIGDSISAGYGNEGTFPCTFGAPTENHYLTYEALAARTLGAELYTEAWSGIGMLRNNDGGTMNTMPQLYPRTLPGNAASVWNFTAYVPDAVLINLGTNDFAKGDPGVAFQSTYTDFVKMLRAHYPAARFFLAVGPMLGGAPYQKALTYLNGVISARATAGDKNLALLEFGTQDVTQDGVGCDYHPSLETHQKLADKMVSALKADLAW